MTMSKENVLAFLRDGLADDEAQALREQVARAISRRLSENGFRLYIHYGFEGDAGGLRGVIRLHQGVTFSGITPPSGPSTFGSPGPTWHGTSPTSGKGSAQHYPFMTLAATKTAHCTDPVVRQTVARRWTCCLRPDGTAIHSRPTSVCHGLNRSSSGQSKNQRLSFVETAHLTCAEMALKLSESTHIERPHLLHQDPGRLAGDIDLGPEAR